MGAEPARSTGGAHTYCGGRDAATAAGLEMTAGASALGRRGHVQEDISSDAPAIAKSQLLAESAYRADARGAARKPIGRKRLAERAAAHLGDRWLGSKKVFKAS